MNKQAGFIALIFILSISFALAFVVFSFANVYSLVLSMKRNLVVRSILRDTISSCKHAGMQKIASGLIGQEGTWFPIRTGINNLDYTPVYTSHYESLSLNIFCNIIKIESKKAGLLQEYYLYIQSHITEKNSTESINTVSKIIAPISSNRLVEEHTKLY